MKNRWTNWLASLAAYSGMLAIAALLCSSALAQGERGGGLPGTSPDYSGSLQQGSARLADFVQPSGVRASEGVTQTQFVDRVDYFLEEMQGPPSAFYDAAVPPYGGGVGYAVAQDLNEVFYRVGRVNREFYGISEGYTNINAFIPLGVSDDQHLWFLNPRVNLTDNSRGGANIGLGHRLYVPEEDRVYGMSYWWDYDAGHAGSFHQMGGSFETIGRYLSWRFNFSIPVGKDTHLYNRRMGDPFFFEDNIAFLEFRNVETAYQQYDVEASMPMPYLGRYGGTLGVGLYYLNGRGVQDGAGVSTRVEAQVTEDFWINTMITSDRIYGSNVSINFELTIPNGMPSQVFSPLAVTNWMTQSVRRNYRVATITNVRGRRRLFLSPKDGLPIQVAHIDPDAIVAGIGTVESPHMSVADYMAVPAATRADIDIIFVRRRADGTDINLDTTITLLDCQRLLGDGTTHNFDSTLGTFVLPGFTPGPAPLLSNSGAAFGTPVVTLANGNEVSGFTIDAGSNSDGIRGTGIDGFNINRNTFQNIINGIVITSDTSPATGLPLEDRGIISQNVLNGSGFGSIDGVLITHTAGTLDLLIADNTVRGFRGEDANGDGLLEPSEDLNMNGILDPGEDLNMNGILDLGEDINGNGILDQGRGIAVLNLGGTINADDPGDLLNPTGIVRNIVDDSGTGIQVIGAFGSDTNLSINANQITNSTDFRVDPDGNFLAAGLDVVSFGPGTTVDFNSVTGNLVTGGAGDGASFVASGGGTMTFTDPTMSGDPVITANFFTSNAGHGATFEAELAGVMFIEDISGNAFYNNGQNGANFEARSGGDLTLEQFIGNTANGNGQNGVAILSDGPGSTVLFSLGTLDLGGDNTMSGNGEAGISLLANDFGSISGSILNNNVTGNLNGLSVVGTDFGVIDLNDSVAGRRIAGNNFSNNTEMGVQISALDSDIDALLHLNTITGNGSFGIGMFNNTVVGPSTLNVIIGGSIPADMQNTITGNGDAGIAGEFLGTSMTTTHIQNNIISGNVNAINVDYDGEGIHLRAGEFANLVATVFDNAITGNAGAGARLFANGNATVIDGLNPGFDLRRNTITGNGFGNGGGGVSIFRDGDAFIMANLDSNIVNQNFGSGLDVFTIGGSAGAAETMVFASNNEFSQNTLHGVNFLIDGTSSTFANLVANTINANGVHGITVSTDNGGFFGIPLATPSVFDGNIITNHTAGSGIFLTQLATSTLLLNVVGDTQTSEIRNNGNGIVVNHLGAGAINVTVGNLANPFPDVRIEQNTNNGITYNIFGTGTANLTVNNTVLSGNRLTGGPSNHGIEVDYTNAATSSLTVNRTSITNFGVDGINVDYNRSNDLFGSFAMLVEDSIVGQDLFNFNGDDGFDLTVRDAGASFIIRNTDVIGNGKDGVLLVTIAEDDNPGPRGQFNGRTLTVIPNVDTDGNGIPDFVNEFNPGLNADPFYLFPWGDSFVGLIDFQTFLTIDNGSRVDFNREHGVHIEAGSQTRPVVSLQGSSFSGNTVSDLHFIPIVSGNPTGLSVNNAEPNPDNVVLDPAAHLILNFGNLAPNTGNRITSSVFGPDQFTGPAGDPFKPATRPVHGFFTVNVPDPFAPPIPNNFTLFGVPLDETTLFPGWIVNPL